MRGERQSLGPRKPQMEFEAMEPPHHPLKAVLGEGETCVNERGKNFPAQRDGEAAGWSQLWL